MGNLQKQPQKMFCKKKCFRNFTKFREKHQCQSLSSLIKLQVSGIAFFDTQKDYCFTKLGLKTRQLISTLNMFTHYICQRSYRTMDDGIRIQKLLEHFLHVIPNALSLAIT